MPRFSANLGFLWPDRPLIERVAAAGRAGFRAIEVHWPYDVRPEDVKAACERHGLSQLGLNTRPGNIEKGEIGLGALPGREKDFAAAFDEAVSYCVAAGFTSIHAMAGIVLPNEKTLAKKIFAKNLAAVADTAAAHGLTVLLEPLNPRDAPGYFYSTIEEATEMIRIVGRPNIRLMFDCYHVAIGQGDVLRRLERHLPMIGHVQIAAVPSRAEPDEGEIAYRAIFSALDALGYNGWVGCEYRPRADTDAGLRWIEMLSSA